MKNIGLFLLVSMLALASAGVQAAEKWIFGASTMRVPLFYMPGLVAEEKGFWKEAGLNVEFIPFKGGTPLYKAAAAGEAKMGVSSGPSFILAASAGVPITIVAQIAAESPFYFWVRADSPLKRPKDIKGSKIGVSSLGSLTYIYAKAIARALGVEKDVNIVATGGVPQSAGALRAGRIDLMPTSTYTFLELEIKGQMRRLLRVADYLPKPWVETVAFAERGFTKSNPDAVRRAIGTVLKAINFMRDNPSWTMAKMKGIYGYSDEAAKKAYEFSKFTRGGEIDVRGLENITNFLVEYGLIRKGKALPVRELYTTGFLK